LRVSQTENGNKVSIENAVSTDTSESWGLNFDIRIHEFSGKVVLDNFVNIGVFFLDIFGKFFPIDTGLIVLYIKFYIKNIYQLLKMLFTMSFAAREFGSEEAFPVLKILKIS